MMWARRLWMKLQTLFRCERSAILPYLKEETRDTWGWIWLEQIGQDVRYGFRLLLKNRSFTLVAVFTLALGIAATTTLYSIFDGAYIHFGETAQGNRVVLLLQHLKDRPPTLGFSSPEYFDISSRHHYQSFDGFFAVHGINATLSESLGQDENPEHVHVVRMTANMFSLYGISALVGRTFTADEDLPGGPNVAVLTYRLWKTRFGLNPNIRGKIIYLNGVPYTTIGVMGRRSEDWGADLYTPLDLDPASNNRSQRDLAVGAVTREGFFAEQTEPELVSMAHREEADYGAAYPEYKGVIYEPIDVRRAVVGDLRIALYILMGAVAMLALITAANIASLLVARTMARAGEIGTRLALGAKPARLARQFLTESVLLSVLAGVVGVVVGMCALKPILVLIPERYIGTGTDIHTSLPALLISVLVALALGVLFGLAPASFISRRGTATNLQQSRTRSATDRRGGRMRAALVLVEMALAFVVIIGASLMVRTYRQLTAMDLGFHRDHVLTMTITLPQPKYPTGTEIANFFRELLVRVRSLPGVTDACVSSVRPAGAGLFLHEFSIPGRSLNATGGIERAAYRVVTPSYFSAIRTPLRAGRFMDDQDGPQSLLVAVVNESFARTYFPNEDALGKRIRLENQSGSASSAAQALSNEVLQIVGVVKDARQIAYWGEVSDFYKPIPPELYVPLWQHPEAGREMSLIVRTETTPESLSDAVRRQVLAVDREQPVYEVQTLQALTENGFGPTRLCLLILGIFAGTALLTACVGLYAIVSYSVAQRTHEIGIRIALGAKQREVLGLVAREGIPVVAVGIVVGLAASLGMTRLISSLLYGVAPNDPFTLLAVSSILIATAMLAVYIPARRAVSIDPMEALHYE